MADVSELVIQIRATTEGLEATLENASQLVRKFAREAEAAISKPIEVDMQTDSLKDVISGMMGLGKETKNAFNASSILKAGLLDLGSSIVTGGINALIGLVIQGIAALFQAAAEAKKKQEEARQEAIKNSEEMARKYSDTAQDIRALGEEYAELGSKIRTASEEKTFLDLQADLAAALGITEGALKSQIQTLDDYYQKIAEAERRNAGEAAGEYRKAAESRQETDEYTKLVKDAAYDTTRERVPSGGSWAIGLGQMALYRSAEKEQEIRQNLQEKAKEILSDVGNSVIEEARSQGAIIEQDLAAILIQSMADSFDIDSMPTNATEQELTQWLKERYGGFGTTLKTILNEPQFKESLDILNNIPALLAGGMSTGEVTAARDAALDSLQNSLPKAFQALGVEAGEAEKATAGLLDRIANQNALLQGGAWTGYLAQLEEVLRHNRLLAEGLEKSNAAMSLAGEAKGYTDAAAKIREYAKEYADLRSQKRSASEEKRFLELQGELAGLMGISTEAIYAQSASRDAWAKSTEKAVKAQMEFAHVRYEKGRTTQFGAAEATVSASYGADGLIPEVKQEAIDRYVKGIRLSAEEIRAATEAAGIEVGESFYNFLQSSGESAMRAMSGQWTENMSVEQALELLNGKKEQILAGFGQVMSNTDLSVGMEGFGGIVDKLLFGSITPEEATEGLTTQMDAIIQAAAAMYESMGQGAEEAEQSAWKLFDTFTNGERDMGAYANSIYATGLAVSQAAQQIEDMGTRVTTLEGGIAKAKGLKDHAKVAKDAISSYKALNGEMKKNPEEIAKVNTALNRLGKSFDGSTESLEQAEQGLGDFEASLLQQAVTLQNTVTSLEAEFAALGDAAYVDGVLTADAKDLLEKIALSKGELAELIEELKAAGMFGGGNGRGGGSRRKSKAELAEEARRAAEEARQEAIRQDYAMLDHQKHLNQLTLEDELQMLYQIRQAHELNAEEIMEWEQKVYDVRQELRRRDAASIDKAGDALIEALGARYQAMQDAEIQRLDASRKAWEDWRDDSVQAIRDQIAALDELSKTEDREKQDQEELRKIAKLRQDIEFEQDSYNRMKLQQQLDQAISAREDRLRRLGVEDQKAALLQQIEAIQDQAEAQFTALDSQQEEIEKAYAERMKTAALRAEAEKLLMTGSQREIVSLIGEFAPEYDALGKTLGEKLLEGFQSKVGGVVAWFQGLNDSLYAIQEQAAAEAIAAANQFQSGYQQRQQNSAAASNLPPTVVNQTVNFNEPVESAGEAAKRVRQANEELGALLYGG